MVLCCFQDKETKLKKLTPEERQRIMEEEKEKRKVEKEREKNELKAKRDEERVKKKVERDRVRAKDKKLRNVLLNEEVPKGFPDVQGGSVAEWLGRRT